MTNLTEAAKFSRTAIKGLGVLLVVIVVGQILLRVTVQLYRQLNPPPPPPPTVGFGLLPKIVFGESDVSSLTFKLETVGNSLPSFGPSAKVFLMSFNRSGFLDLERAKKQAASLGFVLEPTQINATQFRWTRTNPLPATLDLDVVTNSFSMEVSWETDPGFLNSRLLPDGVRAISEVRGFLTGGQFLPDDLAGGESKTTFLKYSGGNMTETVSLSEADFIQVDLFRKKIDEFRVVTVDPDNGLARVIVSGSRGQGRRIVEVEYDYTNVAYDQFETYPLISGSQAWQMLVEGQGFVAKLPQTGTQAVVRKLDFGYFDSLDDQAFLQPVYIFEGDLGFVGYVPAIVPDWYQDTEIE